MSTDPKRSELMARIGSEDTRPERVLRRALWASGLRYRKYLKTPVGRPDLVFPGPRVAVFVDGCFWHGCPDHYVRPRSRADFWSDKLGTNVDRDRRQTLELESLGWKVVRVWECEVHHQPSLEREVDLVGALVKQTGVQPRQRWVVVRVNAAENDLEHRHEEQLRDPEQRRITVRQRITAKRRTK